ncbi:MAG: hypothetical protein KatS3mg131_2477 [Candidatus Tectimicrobiota bacterium]|nr:MAG: hypothetical protein KatS3mg131_2477 [Candidatus Tectomicrobia bacterium]
MATHQTIAGFSDAELLQRMVDTHGERFHAGFWALVAQEVMPRLPAQPVVVDLGCGPGLFLRDLLQRYPHVRGYGYDVTPAMIAHAQQLGCGPQVTFAVHDVTAQPLPLAPASVDLVCMTAVLHLFDDPFAVLAEATRLLHPGGLLLLYDWIRRPLATYLAERLEGEGEARLASRQRWLRLFPVHNKYTSDDWQWLLAEARFSVLCSARLRPHFEVFVATPQPASK